jgi:hypothetical protein
MRGKDPSLRMRTMKEYVRQYTDEDTVHGMVRIRPVISFLPDRLGSCGTQIAPPTFLTAPESIESVLLFLTKNGNTDSKILHSVRIIGRLLLLSLLREKIGKREED